MRPLLSITVLAAAALLVASPALAQGSRAVAHTQVTVVIPERASAGDSRPARSQPSDPAMFASSSVRASGRNDLGGCTETLDLGAIGRASVSCIETAEPGRMAGIVLELQAVDAESGSADLLEVQLRLDGSTVLGLVARPWVRDGRDVWRLTIPATAVERIVASGTVSLSAQGREHVLRSGDLALLRRAIGLPVHHASRE